MATDWKTAGSGDVLQLAFMGCEHKEALWDWGSNEEGDGGVLSGWLHISESCEMIYSRAEWGRESKDEKKKQMPHFLPMAIFSEWFHYHSQTKLPYLPILHQLFLSQLIRACDSYKYLISFLISHCWIFKSWVGCPCAVTVTESAFNFTSHSQNKLVSWQETACACLTLRCVNVP